MNFPCPRLHQNFCAFAHRRAGGVDVIDKDNRFSSHLFFVFRIKDESAANVAEALFGVQVALTGRRAGAAQEI
jgi:hypothetical protein